MKVLFLTVSVLVVLLNVGILHAHKKKPRQQTGDYFCPRADPNQNCTNGNLTQECSGDLDCKLPNQKCCFDNCMNRKCIGSIRVSPMVKEGACPVFTFDPRIACSPLDPIFFDCRVDSECRGNLKCCQDGPCGFKKCKVPKAGRCPEYPFPNLATCPPFNEGSFECRKDTDCTGARKCCRNSCFLLTCQNPIIN